MAIVYQNDTAGKICANPDCGWKPLTEFHRRRLLGISVGDGYKARCKDCLNAQDRAKWASDPETHRQKATRSCCKKTRSYSRTKTCPSKSTS